MVHIIIALCTIFFAVMLFFNLHSDSPEGFEEDVEEAVSQVWWEFFGPIIAIIIINLGELVYVFAAAR